LSSLEQRQSELQSRLSQIDSEIAKLDDAFVALAAEFNGTDGASSLRQAEQIEQRLSSLRREKAICLHSQSHVTKLQLDEKEQQAEQARKALMAKAKEISSGVITLNEEIDTALVQLRGMFERRFALLSQLNATGVVDQQFVVKLQGKSGPTRACCAAGLHKFVSIEKVATQSFVPLASCNAILLGVGKAASASVPELVDPPPSPTNGNGSVPRHRREVIP
jgi:hypothetical protein